MKGKETDYKCELFQIKSLTYSHFVVKDTSIQYNQFLIETENYTVFDHSNTRFSHLHNLPGKNLFILHIW